MIRAVPRFSSASFFTTVFAIVALITFAPARALATDPSALQATTSASASSDSSDDTDEDSSLMVMGDLIETASSTKQ